MSDAFPSARLIAAELLTQVIDAADALAEIVNYIGLANERNFDRAFAEVSSSLRERINCGRVDNEASRFALQSRNYEEAAKLALKRSMEAPWDPVACENLLLAQAAQGTAESIQYAKEHLFGENGCSRCRSIYAGAGKTPEPDLVPMRRAAAELIRALTSVTDGARSPSWRDFRAAVEEVAPSPESRMWKAEVESTIQRAIGPSVTRDDVTALVNLVFKLDGNDWSVRREMECLRRLLIAARGAATYLLEKSSTYLESQSGSSTPRYG
jgi:hypothetical protein